MDPQRLFKNASTADPGRGRTIVSIGVAAASFLFVAWLLQNGLAAIGREPRSQALEHKWQEFECLADECDVLFVGTSRVERNLDPAAFDEALREQGIAARSFNFGLPRMSILEAEAVLERVEARRPRQLKVVAIDPTLFVFDTDNWSHERELATHDWPRTWRAVRHTLAAERRHGAPWTDCLRFAAPHLLSFAGRKVNLGQAAPLVFPPQPGAAEGAGDAPLRAGYRPLPVVRDENAPWRERFRRFLALPSPPDWRGTPLAEEELAYYDGLLRRVRRLGAKPVLFAAPRVKRDSHMAAVLASHRACLAETALVDYLRGHSDEELYSLELWHDFDHLNADGARRLSRMLARDLAAMVANGESNRIASPNRRLAQPRR